jgi:pimeloyl-ACP methyl ester carboxylesterase
MKILGLSLSLVVACSVDDGARVHERADDPSSDLDAGSEESPESRPDASEDPDTDATVREDAAVPSDRDAAVAPAGDYREPGGSTVTASVESFEAGTCSLEVGAFRPATELAEVAVVIAPGFALGPGLGSSRAALDTLAAHVASWGITTYTLDLCTNGGSIDHAQNGEALAAFGDSLGRPVVYAGFSAGGLAAMIAAAQAERTHALLALDAVDTSDLAGPALDAIDAPVHALAGEPSSCNSDANMLARYEGRPIRVLKINMAQHFIFEGAACTGFKCALCSGGGEREAQAVRTLATAFALGVSGAVPSALDWWRAESAELKAWIDDGLVSELQ